MFVLDVGIDQFTNFLYLSQSFWVQLDLEFHILHRPKCCTLLFGNLSSNSDIANAKSTFSRKQRGFN